MICDDNINTFYIYCVYKKVILICQDFVFIFFTKQLKFHGMDSFLVSIIFFTLSDIHSVHKDT